MSGRCRSFCLISGKPLRCALSVGHANDHRNRGVHWASDPNRDEACADALSEARAEVRRIKREAEAKDEALAEAASIGNRYGMFSDGRPMNDHARLAQKALAALSPRPRTTNRAAKAQRRKK